MSQPTSDPPIAVARARHVLGKLWIIASIALATVALAWPSFVNMGPFFIADTTAYLRGADAAVSTALSHDSIWSDKRALYTAREPAALDEGERSTQPGDIPAKVPLLGRSIYYGAFVYLPVVALGEHAGVIVQSALAALLVWLALIPIAPTRPSQRLGIYFGAILLLAMGTSLPFTASLLAPDFLTGVASIALIMLLCCWQAYSRWQIAILAGLILLAALSHSSNLPILLVLSVAGILLRKRARLATRAALIGIGAVALGFAGEALFVAAVEKTTARTPVRPPFLTARLIADGPGQRFLQTHCAGSDFEVCRYQARTAHDSDLFLWSEGPEGVFTIADAASRQRLSQQDVRFAVATFSAYPDRVLASTLAAFARQVRLVDLTLWRGKSDGGTFFNLANLPDPVATRMANTRNAQGNMPVAVSEFAIQIWVFVSLALIMICLMSRTVPAGAARRHLAALLALTILAILANAAIAGGLSKPDARYNLRVIWILPLLTYWSVAQIFLANRQSDQSNLQGF